MKKLIILLSLISIGICDVMAQRLTNDTIYQDFGTWEHVVSGRETISIHAYVTKEKIYLEKNLKELKQKTVSAIPQYRYELKMISKSKLNGEYTDTWLYETKIYINDVEITKKQFPDGFIVPVKPKETLVYWYESTLNNINFRITWENSVIEPRQ